ncbi:MAG TPA: bifunctional UDP-N-acetylglucosamine diphosphorylase/glucosamine-1-phosphate N-acetyltransferase GlmU [Petrotogaceae bacterium]|nr:bifunctional UDP-N-acetylglucosamine diphosphorylase/glucosamine-1-phosphate N-acetyltransferase GlmU [Petrotogaceae bacterium]HQH32130.1 bifunctional UDP-N-acetylglucosamine diphosphorylase/glucosamine-1-phosphate N-acetyltransferase GlmU [Petrotogaceae bacterium]HQI79265.1 bifunctional UDP-N-acetylglucosamine diphosphorylase/glucosamine-1-phosphate N-acetyltransferase GlmU [Petrotogaceae bacterium]
MKTLILAAGKGTRMKSKYPKVLHKILNKPIINWVVDTAALFSQQIGVVLGFGAQDVQRVLPPGVLVFEQKEQLGTGHAVMCAQEFLDSGELLVLYGDVPLISSATLNLLIEKHRKEKNDATVLTFELDNPTGYGRILKQDEKLVKIIEEKDANEQEKKICELNSGIAVYDCEKLKLALKKISSDNAQGEYYLPDVFLFFKKVGLLQTNDPVEVSGINDRVQLSDMQAHARERINRNLMLQGVTITDPLCTYIGPDVKIGSDTVIHPQSYVFGKTAIGQDCEIGPMSVIYDSEIGNNVKVIRSEMDKTTVFDGASIGPFARMREGTVIEENVKIGDFVETKKTTLKKNSKAQHLAYLGDATIGENTNIGAGTITCNYDGVNKHKTFIGDNSFIGSNSSIVAPVNIGKNSIVGAGSVITKDVPEYSLALGRARQENKDGWVNKKNKKGD